LEQHRVALPNDHTICRLSTWHPVGVGENLDPTTGRRRPGSVVLDVGNQVAQGATKQHANEEDAKDREQP
jgi:hypothetical protein